MFSFCSQTKFDRSHEKKNIQISKDFLTYTVALLLTCKFVCVWRGVKGEGGLGGRKTGYNAQTTPKDNTNVL